MSQQLFSSPVGLSQLDPPIRERLAIPLASNTGGSAGDDGLVNFVTGAEVFVFTSMSIRGPQKPKAITTAWIDAANLAAGKTLTVLCSNGQKFILQNTTAAAGQGPQGYFIIPLPAPFTITVSTNNGAALQVVIILYNYNVAFTGFQMGNNLPANAAVSGSTGAGSSGSGGGGVSSGGGGSGLRCPIVGTDITFLRSNTTCEREEFENDVWVEVKCGEFSLTATLEHPVYSIEKGKVTLDEVALGHFLLTDSGEAEVTSKMYFRKTDKGMKITVPKSHLYYANGILSHNKA